MNATTTTPPAAETTSPGNQAAPVAPALIDQSCRTSVLFLLACSVGWLLLGNLLGIIAAIKMHAGGFLAQAGWLTYGRVHPAVLTILLYGFACQAALGIALWMIARLSRNVLSGTPTILFAGLFWNLGVALGVLGVLGGHSSGFEWLELPALAAPLLFVSYALIVLWALITFHQRRQRELYVSQWYLFAALLWFAWIFSTAQLLLNVFPVRGVMKTVVSRWYGHNLLAIVLGGFSLAILFYYFPKVAGRPLHSRYLAIFGFWSLLFFGSWGGLQAGLPMPKWLGSICIVMGVLALIPMLASALNWHLTLAGEYHQFKTNPIFRFLLFAALCYVGASLLGVFSAQRDVNAITQFTVFNHALTRLILLGFVAMALFGAIYDLVPRIAQADWPSPKLIDFHFYLSAAGVVISVAALMMGGLLQGMDLNTPQVPPVALVKRTMPFLGLSTLGTLLMFVGSLGLAVNFGKLLAANCGCLNWINARKAG